MQGSSIQEALAELPTGGALNLSVRDIPLDELLFTLHTGRFTGAMRVVDGDAPDRIYFREGAVVGLAPSPRHDVEPLAELLVQMKLLSDEALGAVWDDGPPEDGVALNRVLLDSGLLGPEDINRAAEEHARRRLFTLYDAPSADVELRAGLESLAHFNPIYLDVRPAISFGMVVRADSDRKATMARRVRGRSVRLVVPYDERRNSYGLPPPVLIALRDLARGTRLQTDVKLPGLSASETAGVLMLFDRMSLLQVD